MKLDSYGATPARARSHHSSVVSGQVRPSHDSATTTVMAARCARRNHGRFTHGQPRQLPSTTSKSPPTTNSTIPACSTSTASASSA